jgi:hypothetical protein
MSTKERKLGWGGINGSILEEDKQLLGFNYVPLVALFICLQLNSEVRAPLQILTIVEMLFLSKKTLNSTVY